MTGRPAALALLALLGCRATTSRPSFEPFPESEHTEIGFGLEDKVVTVMRVTDTLVAYLRADSIPVDRIHPFDGYLESGWFEAGTLQPTGRRPLGDSVVRVRAWVAPGKPGYARVEVETAYRPLADPSLPARELEAPVAPLHPVNKRIGALLDRLKSRYGPPEDDTTKAILPVNRPPPVPGDSARADTARADSTRADSARVDTARVDTARTDSARAAVRRPAARPDSARIDSVKAAPAVPPAPPPTPKPDSARTDSVPAPAAAPTPGTRGIWVQAVAATSREVAEQVLVKVKEAGFPAFVMPRDQLFLVRAGPFPTRAAGMAAIARIKEGVGGEPFLVVNP